VVSRARRRWAAAAAGRRAGAVGADELARRDGAGERPRASADRRKTQPRLKQKRRAAVPHGAGGAGASSVPAKRRTRTDAARHKSVVLYTGSGRLNPKTLVRWELINGLWALTLLGPFFVGFEGGWQILIFIFLYLFFQDFSKKKCVISNLQNYGTAVGGATVFQTSYHTAFVTVPGAGTVASATVVWRLKLVRFQIIITFFMNSDGGKLFMKIVAFHEICNFVVQTIFI
jgi:hypothetical protein